MYMPQSESRRPKASPPHPRSNPRRRRRSILLVAVGGVAVCGRRETKPQQHPQHFMEQEQDAGDVSSSTASKVVAAGSGDVDRVLFKNLVEIVPLVESLMDRRASTSFTRRASVVYTRPPARESLVRKEAKGRKTTSMPPKKRGTDNDQGRSSRKDNRDSWIDDSSVSSLRKLPTEKDHSELSELQQQIEDLQKKLLEKDEVLNAKVNELTSELAGKGSIVESTQLQLSDAQMKLADKQASLEKLQWELMTSRSEIEKLQENLNYVDREAAILLQVIETLAKDSAVDGDTKSSNLDYQLPIIEQVEVANETEIHMMEHARQSYIEALAFAKGNPSEESLALVAEARRRLWDFALGL